jgi:2-polyprenyl-6-methoxyphenol hydroxylase-like FAD-dependent oxidoreductase
MLLNHVVIIGGGIAGMVHARISADYAERVTILERDQFSDTAEPRSGTPQSQHVHFLLARGLLELDTLFPGFRSVLINDMGAPDVVIGLDTHFRVLGQWIPRVDAGIHTVCASRPEIEHVLRSFIVKNPRIDILSRTEAMGLQFDDNRVTGVVTRQRGMPADKRIIDSNLVVDASGRRSNARDWLEQAGFPTPVTTRIDPSIGYASRWYQKEETAANNWRVLYQFTNPPDQRRGGVILEHSKDRWLTSLVGINSDYPPTDEADFMEFARSLPDPTIYNTLQNARPISGIVGYQNAPNEWHHYERLGHLPQGFLVTGDALCIVNPVYGQGMTKAVLNAQLFGEMLSSGQIDAKSFYQKVARLNQDIWDTAALGDLNYPNTTSTTQQTVMESIKRLYLTAVLRASTRNMIVGRAFNRVLNMIDPASTLMMPDMVLRVLRAQRARPY